MRPERTEQPSLAWLGVSFWCQADFSFNTGLYVPFPFYSTYQLITDLTAVSFFSLLCERKYIFFVLLSHSRMLPVLTIRNENNHNFLRLDSPHCVLEMKNSLPCVQDNAFN